MTTPNQKPKSGGAAAEVPRELLLIKPGVTHLADGRTYNVDAESAHAVLENYRRLGRDVVVDYEHQTLGGEYSSPDGIAPAAGWITGLRWDPARGLVAAVRWVRRGARAVAEGAYRYFSPVIAHERDGQVKALHSVAITNDPATINAPALIAARAGVAPRRHVTILAPRRLACSPNRQLVCANDEGKTMPVDNTTITESLVGVIAELNNAVETIDLDSLDTDGVGAAFADLTAGGQQLLAALASMIGAGETAPPGDVSAARRSTSSGSVDRGSIIAAAKRAFEADIARGKTVLCSARGYVDLALRDRELRPLSAVESARHGLDETTPGVSSRANAAGRSNVAISAETRAALISTAVRNYEAETASGVKVMCDRRAYVNQMLRETGCALLSESESV